MKFKFENLEVWQLGTSLTKQIYLLTKHFSKEEVYNMTSQIRRAALSVPLNIAEGSGRFSGKEFSQYTRVAIGSLMEVDTCLKISVEVGFLETSKYEEISSRMVAPLYFKLIKLEKSLRTRPRKQQFKQIKQLPQLEQLEHLEQLERLPQGGQI